MVLFTRIFVKRLDTSNDTEKLLQSFTSSSSLMKVNNFEYCALMEFLAAIIYRDIWLDYN